jgi:peptidylprolyl isomerase
VIRLYFPAFALLFCAQLGAADAPGEADWRTPDPDNLLYMELPGGRVIIELAPAFAPGHVGNIRTLAREHFWDGTSIYRAVDNFVVQFGDPDAEDASRAKSLGSASKHLPAEFHRDAKDLAFEPLPDADAWAPEVGFAHGFPAARDAATGKAWMVHCYGTVGAGRSNADDSSLGAELYVAIGESPRRLDANLSVVGRVLQGMELLSTVRRGPAGDGVYADASARTPIASIRLASELPEALRVPLQVMRTDTPAFRERLESQRRRVDAFYKRAAGRIDVCGARVPVRGGAR